jgi:glycosyltransferase involved in cell wall biosynthesis
VAILLDLSHTSHTRARTGIQRVARALHRELDGRCDAVCFDPYEGAWRPLEPWEERNLTAADPARGRGAQWPLAARARGRLRAFLHRPAPLGGLGAGPGAQAGVIVPEIFSAEAAGRLPALFDATRGPRVALFHDAIALQFPEFTPLSTSARFPGYMRDLLLFDGVAAVSEDSRRCLVDYWAWLGAERTPQVAAITLGIETPRANPPPAAPRDAPTVLCVGSIEGRKNHAALLDACESLWSRGVKFELRLIGLANAETGAPALERIERLRAAGRPVRYAGPEGDEALEEAYRECAFTVYPSIAEGFGLPVAESLARGRACLCRTEGALGEIAAGGGCAGLGAAGAADIAAAMGLLLASPYELALLDAAARARRFKGWAQYTGELLAWMETLGREAK